MRTLIFLGLAIGAAFMANWFTIERDGDHTRIDINKSEIRNDAKNAIEKGREILDKRERERQAEARTPDGYMPPDGYAAPDGDWPPSTPAHNTGYTGQGAYGNQPGYNGQQGQPYGDPGYDNPYEGGPIYDNPSPPGGYAPSYPAPTGDPAPTRNPPPWQR